MILIEKDKAIEKTWEEPSYSDPLNVLTEIRDRLNALPTIDIVRCRECKRWNTVIDHNKAEYGLCQNRSQLEATKADFYCADGERRSEDE